MLAKQLLPPLAFNTTDSKGKRRLVQDSSFALGSAASLLKTNFTLEAVAQLAVEGKLTLRPTLGGRMGPGGAVSLLAKRTTSEA